jgi:hypothetical protein
VVFYARHFAQDEDRHPGQNTLGPDFQPSIVKDQECLQWASFDCDWKFFPELPALMKPASDGTLGAALGPFQP